MQAITLAGGYGTRLSRMYPDLPKALVPVAGKPFLLWQIEWLTFHNIVDLHLALGHKSAAIEEWLISKPVHNTTITTSVESQPLGTAGGLKFAQEFVRTDPFLVFNGDSLLPNLDLQAMQIEHEKSGAVATIAVTRVQQSERFGSIEFDAHHLVTSFREKADLSEGWINCGVYLVSRKMLDCIERERTLSLETDIFPLLVKKELLYAFPTPTPLLDMGTPDGLQATRDYLSRQNKTPK